MYQLRVNGDELVFIRETLRSKAVEAGMSFFVAACFVLLSLLPVLGDRRDPYPWKAALVLWLIGAAAAFPGLLILKTLKGLTFDRKKGVVVQWRVRFGRRREQRHPLSGFDQLHVKTYLMTSSRSLRVSRWYDLELRGRSGPLALTDGWSFGREESEKVASELSGFLKLPIVVEDRNPGDRL